MNETGGGGYEPGRGDVDGAGSAEGSPITPNFEQTADGPLSNEQAVVGQLITEVDEEEWQKERREKDLFLLDAQEFMHRDQMAQVAKAYGFKEDASGFKEKFASFLGRTKAYFAGEFADLKAAKQGEIGWSAKTWMQETSRRFSKVFVKTAVTGGIGAGITAALGGTILGPVFLGALAGAAAGRGLIEAWRLINPKERLTRSDITASRVALYAKAAEYQTTIQGLVAEQESASEDRRQEIDRQIDSYRLELMQIAHEDSYRLMFDQENDEARFITRQDEGFDEAKSLTALFEAKMKGQKRAEKIADLAAAVGSFGGGQLGFAQMKAQLMGEHLTKEKISAASQKLLDQGASVNVDLNSDHTAHFVRQLTSSQIEGLKNVDPGFAELLDANNGLVFQYHPGPEAEAALKAANLTTAQLADGTVVHTLKGFGANIVDTHQAVLDHLRPLAEKALAPEMLQAVAARTAELWRGTMPLVAANLISLIGRAPIRRSEADLMHAKKHTDRIGQLIKDGTEKIRSPLQGHDQEEPNEELGGEDQPAEKVVAPTEDFSFSEVEKEGPNKAAEPEEFSKPAETVAEFERMYRHLESLEPALLKTADVVYTTEIDEKDKNRLEKMVLHRTRNAVHRLSVPYVNGQPDYVGIKYVRTPNNKDEKSTTWLAPPPDKLERFFLEVEKTLNWGERYLSATSRPEEPSRSSQLDAGDFLPPTIETVSRSEEGESPQSILTVLDEAGINPKVFETGKTLQFRNYVHGDRSELLKHFREIFHVQGDISRAKFEIISSQPTSEGDVLLTLKHGQQTGEYYLSALWETHLLKLPKSARKKNGQ